MCGIAGMFAPDGDVDRVLVTRMTAILAHRGPDGDGFYYSKGGDVGLGHRRLSIIDLNTGDQPMCNEDETVWVTFNGEIYNYRELRGELQAFGHQFKTMSDTEVIVHGYEQWGESCVERFNGIFAFAVWDEARRRIFLARDHFGVKPLYYAQRPDRLLFASEIKAILCDSTVSRKIDLDALQLCLTLRHIPSPWTPFVAIKKLAPGSWMTVEHDGTTSIHRYAGYGQEIDRSRSESDWIEELTCLYDGVVRRQMVSDAPIGLSLSGGVDSNTLLALMTRESSGVHTFTVGFHGGEDRDDELDAASDSSTRFAAKFTGRRISETEYSDFMHRYIWHLEEPIGNESAAAYYFVAQLARPQVKVLLSGQGADEPFAGYGRHIAAAYSRHLGWISPRLRDSLAGRLNRFESPRRLLDLLAKDSEVSRFLSVYSITSELTRRKLVGEGLAQTMRRDLPSEYIDEQLQSAPAGTMLERMTYVDARTSLPDNLLLCGDKMSMATSIEMRVPFLDVELMRVAESIPGSLKISRLQNKAIHKKVCETWLPKSFVYRRKVGFNEAMGSWLRGNLDAQLGEAVQRPDSLTRTYLNPAYVEQLRTEHRSGKRDHQRLLFLLYSLETWFRIFV